MHFSYFLKCFYYGVHNTAFGNKSKPAVASVFFKNGMGEEACRICFPSDSNGIYKWYNGTGPENRIWSEVKKNKKEEELKNALLDNIKKEHWLSVLSRFDISTDGRESVSLSEEKVIATAITAQFFKFADEGKNDVDDVFKREYREGMERLKSEPLAAESDLGVFGCYLREAMKLYSNMCMPGAGDCALEDYYVRGNVGTAPVAFPNRNRNSVTVETSLDAFRHYNKQRETPYVILVGACGYGKSLMMQDLFLESAKKYSETGLLPILVRLHNFSAKTYDLISFIVEQMQELDPEIDEDILIPVLKGGKAQILFDGFDEMDAGETRKFQNELRKFRHGYSGNQIVITSRDCPDLHGIREFVTLYLHPLNSVQVEALIKNLQKRLPAPNAAEVMEYLSSPFNNFFAKDGFIATNPMLLTIMVNNFNAQDVKKINKQGFYKKLYDALTKEHDEEKEGYNRVFRSVRDEMEFTQAFREFCAKSCKDGISEFDETTFEKYFKEIKCDAKFRNPEIFTLKNFRFDTCAKACIMYEKDPVAYYIDPGFQHYFAALYYKLAEKEETEAFGEGLWKENVAPDRIEALDMLYAIQPEKVKTCIFLPYLQNLFEGKEESRAFLNYLKSAYGEIEYTLVDRNTMAEIKSLLTVEEYTSMVETDALSNIVIKMIHKVLDLPEEYIMFREVSQPKKTANTTFFLSGILTYAKSAGKNRIRLRRNPIQYYDRVVMHEETDIQEPVIRYDDMKPVCFGYVYKVDPFSLVDNYTEYEKIRDLAQDGTLFKLFNRVREYYAELVAAQNVNQYL